MADQTYNLPQTGEEVQAIINDANGVKGAGATTSLTTDYIMLKDTSGAYHKIQKSSFTEAVRNTLASLLVNNDKGTTISQIAAIASGDFGSVTPGNLASVLGATAQQTEKVAQGSSVDVSLPYGSTWVFKDTIGQSCAIINIAYSGCILVASTTQWSVESEQQSVNHVIKVNKNVTTDGIIRITRVGNTSCRYRYRQLIG